MVRLEFDATIRTVEHKSTEKKDISKDEKSMKMRDTDGINQLIYRGNIDLEGFAPDSTVKIIIESTQKTLDEATAEEAAA